MSDRTCEQQGCGKGEPVTVALGNTQKQNAWGFDHCQGRSNPLNSQVGLYICIHTHTHTHTHTHIYIYYIYLLLKKSDSEESVILRNSWLSIVSLCSWGILSLQWKIQVLTAFPLLRMKKQPTTDLLTFLHYDTVTSGARLGEKTSHILCGFHYMCIHLTSPVSWSLECPPVSGWGQDLFPVIYIPPLLAHYLFQPPMAFQARALPE